MKTTFKLFLEQYEDDPFGEEIRFDNNKLHLIECNDIENKFYIVQKIEVVEANGKLSEMATIFNNPEHQMLMKHYTISELSRINERSKIILYDKYNEFPMGEKANNFEKGWKLFYWESLPQEIKDKLR